MSARVVPCRPAAVVALLVALLTGSAAYGSDAWPVPGHDAARTARSSVVSAQAAALLPGWPSVFAVGAVAPGGAVLAGPGTLNADGTLRRVLRPGFVSGPIGPDGRIYTLHRPTTSGQQIFGVFAYAANGRPLWGVSGLGSPRVNCMEVAERYVWPAPDGTVYEVGATGLAAFDPTGAVRWTGDLGGICGEDLEAPTLAVGPGGTAYFVTKGAGIRAAELVARRPDGTTTWQQPLQGPGNVLAVADDGTIFVAVAGGVEAFAADGTERWRLPLPAPCLNGVAVGADGTLYAVVGCEPGPGALYAISPQGAVRWTFQGGVSLGHPIIGGDGMVYVGERTKLYALRPDGVLAWSFSAGGTKSATSGPSRRGGIKVPGSGLWPTAIGADGTLYAGAFAFARPSAPLRITGLRLSSSRFRVTGTASLCPGRGRPCRPRDPLGSTLSYTLSRHAAVRLTIRNAAGRVVARPTLPAGRAPAPDAGLAGTNWVGIAAGNIAVDGGYSVDLKRLRPGRYRLIATAAEGRARARSGPVRFSIVS